MDNYIEVLNFLWVIVDTKVKPSRAASMFKTSVEKALHHYTVLNSTLTSGDMMGILSLAHPPSTDLIDVNSVNIDSFVKNNRLNPENIQEGLLIYLATFVYQVSVYLNSLEKDGLLELLIHESAMYAILMNLTEAQIYLNQAISNE